MIDGIPNIFQKCGFGNFVVTDNNMIKKKKLIMEYVNDTTGKMKRSLVLCGAVGNGKTHLAVAVLKNIHSQNKNAGGEPVTATGEFMNADEFFSELTDAQFKRQSKLQIIQKHLNYDYFLLDDLGVKNFTEAKRENLYMLINRAYSYNRHLVITTNFSMTDLEKIDERIASRLAEMALIINFNFSDYRTKKIETNNV